MTDDIVERLRAADGYYCYRWPKQTSELCAEAAALIVSLREALEAVKVGDVYGKKFLGVVAGDGCWSVEWPAEGLRILNCWIAPPALLSSLLRVS